MPQYKFSNISWDSPNPFYLRIMHSKGRWFVGFFFAKGKPHQRMLRFPNSGYSARKNAIAHANTFRRQNNLDVPILVPKNRSSRSFDIWDAKKTRVRKKRVVKKSDLRLNALQEMLNQLQCNPQQMRQRLLAQSLSSK